MVKLKFNSLVKRVATALVLVPLVIACLYSGQVYVQLFGLVAGAMLSWEWAYMVPNRRGAFYAVLYTLVLNIGICLGSWPVFWAVMFFAVLLAWYKSAEEPRRNLLVLGVMYISIGVGSVVWLYELVGYALTLWFLLVVWAVDIGGYVVGCTLRGPKLAPKISPNKTWSGLLGGMLFSTLASLVYFYFMGDETHAAAFAALAAAVAVVAQIGDLVESHIKRSLNLKDSSNLIPGHGGVFDRIDGLIFAAPLVFLLFKYASYMM